MIKLDKLYNRPFDVITVDNFMPENEINKIKDNIYNVPEDKASVGTDPSVDKWRISRIKWLPFEEPFLSIYQNISHLIQDYNSDVWRFDLGAITNRLQYTEYHGDEKGKYNWHVDLGSRYNSYRKLSLSIQLSDPSEYEGGDLQIFSPELDPNITSPSSDMFNFKTIDKGIGSVAVFPSFIPHRVTPVTKGVRKSLVLWVGSKPFK